MFTNELKKGTRITLKNGWEAILMDNRKGNVRTAKVFGLYTEIGDIYAFDIVSATVDGKKVEIELTPSQKQAKKLNRMMGW